MTLEPRQRESEYYKGVADAMDVIRDYDFPFTERVDAIAEALAPSRSQGPAEDDNAP
jgi:hypothetical protein